jgi:hypothetical protein
MKREDLRRVIILNGEETSTGYFHQWINDGFLQAIIEKEDGSIMKCDYEDIRFMCSLIEESDKCKDCKIKKMLDEYLDDECEKCPIKSMCEDVCSKADEANEYVVDVDCPMANDCYNDCQFKDKVNCFDCSSNVFSDGIEKTEELEKERYDALVEKLAGEIISDAFDSSEVSVETPFKILEFIKNKKLKKTTIDEEKFEGTPQIDEDEISDISFEIPNESKCDTCNLPGEIRCRTEGEQE